MEKSIREMDSYLDSGGLNIHMTGRVGYVTEFHGASIHNIVQLAKLYLQEHPDAL